MGKLETERSYTADHDAARPDLTQLPGVAQAAEAGTTERAVVYFDTPDGALLRAGVTLARSTGGDEEGWLLQLPAPAGRSQVRVPLSRARRIPPKALRETVAGWTRGAQLESVATLSVRRTRFDLLGKGDRVLAQGADDDVAGVPIEPAADAAAGSPGAEPDEAAEPVRWREWHLELVEGKPKLLAGAAEVLAAAGGETGGDQAALARVLGAPVPVRPPLPTPKKGRPARLLVHARIAEQVAELSVRDSEVRRGEAEGVHKARVACRRLRGALATFRPVLDEKVTEPIRAELRWVAHALGEACDLDVAHDRLRDLADEQDPQVVIGPVRGRIGSAHVSRRKAAYAGAREALATERYVALREELDRLAAAPPWTARAEKDARDVLPGCLQHDLKRLRKRVRQAERSDPEERDEAIHAARRAAKRLRYAAETLQPVWGEDAKSVVKATKTMAAQLGVRQDARVTMTHLTDLAEKAHAAGESAFTYGVLHAEERHIAAEAESRLAGLFSDVDRAVRRAKL